MRTLLIPTLIALVLCAAPQASADTVDLQLILAADVSRSVDPDEFRLQREGYAAAFTDPKVLHAIQSGQYRSIAVTCPVCVNPPPPTATIVPPRFTTEGYDGEIIVCWGRGRRAGRRRRS